MGQYSCSESDEIDQQHYKDLYQCPHVPTAETNYRLAAEQYEGQGNGDRDMRCLRKYLKKEDENDRRQTITLETSRKCKRKVERL